MTERPKRLADFPPHVAQIIRAVASEFDLHPDLVFADGRSKSFVEARQIVFFVYRKRYEKSFPDMGRLFGYDHSTIVHHVQSVEKRSTKDLDYASLIARVMNPMQIVALDSRDARERTLDALGPEARELVQNVEAFKQDAQRALAVLCATSDDREAQLAYAALRTAGELLATFGPVAIRTLTQAARLLPPPPFVVTGDPAPELCCTLAALIPGRRCPVHAPLEPSFTTSDTDRPPEFKE